MPKCTNSSLYNRETSFHSFPVDPPVWGMRWGRTGKKTSTLPKTPGSVVGILMSELSTAGGLKRLQMGTIHDLSAWNGNLLPVPRPGVWERRPWAKSDILSILPHQFEVAIWTSESKFLTLISSPPWPRINTQVLFCKPTPANTREWHSTPDQSCYELIPTPQMLHIRWNAGELHYLVFGVVL